MRGGSKWCNYKFCFFYQKRSRVSRNSNSRPNGDDEIVQAESSHDSEESDRINNSVSALKHHKYLAS